MPLSLDRFKQFLVENNVLAIAAGIAFGQATLQLIKSFVGDIALPAVYALFWWTYRTVTRTRACDADGAGAAVPKLGSFATEVLTYFLILTTAFFLIDRVFRSIILQAPPKSMPPTAPAAPAAKSAEESVHAADAVVGGEGFHQEPQGTSWGVESSSYGLL